MLEIEQRLTFRGEGIESSDTDLDAAIGPIPRVVALHHRGHKSVELL
jgi:hypothetical protein